MLVLLAALASVYRSGSFDYWFHLGAGRAIREHGFPAREVWCISGYGQAPFLAGWPYQVALHEIQRLAGEAGVACWRAGWTALAAGLAVLLLRVVGAASWPAWVLGLLVIAASRDALRVRPEQVLLALLLFALLELERARRQTRDRTRLLVPAQVLWANTHPAWVIGPIVSWIYSISEWWAETGHPAAGVTPAANRSRAWMILGLVLWAASALTPTPLIGLATPFRFLAPFHLHTLAAPLDWLQRWNWSRDRFEPFTLLAFVWLLAWALGGLRLWRSAPGLAIVSVAMMALGFYSAQFRDLAAWTAWAPMALALGSEGTGLASRLRSGVALVAGVAGLIWLVPSARFPFGVEPLTGALPVRAVALADSAHIDGQVLNTPESGGYILAVRGVMHPPLIDPRLRGSEEFLENLMDAQTMPMALDTFLEKAPFSHAIVPLPRNRADNLASNLSQHLEWALVWYDDGGCLYVRWKDHPELTARAYRYLTPNVVPMTQMIVQSMSDSGLARRLEVELLRARAASPFHARACIWLGELALAHGRPADAVRFLEEADRIAPDTPRLAIALGRAYQRAGNPAKARAALRRALHQSDDVDYARRMLQEGGP